MIDIFAEQEWKTGLRGRKGKEKREESIVMHGGRSKRRFKQESPGRVVHGTSNCAI